ncbi:MAG: type II toxin-antitoxin system VapC family toxin [Pyrinomonadaceae bacterium]
MATYFFDSSALAKRYVAETGTAWVQSLTDPATGNSLYVARITLVELVSAITRRQRNGDLTTAAATAVLSDIQADFVSDYQVIEVAATLVAAASALAEKHALRGYDAVQLAAALEVNAAFVSAGQPPVTIISADLDLNTAGVAEGLNVDDPNTHCSRK